MRAQRLSQVAQHENIYCLKIHIMTMPQSCGSEFDAALTHTSTCRDKANGDDSLSMKAVDFQQHEQLHLLMTRCWYVQWHDKAEKSWTVSKYGVTTAAWTTNGSENSTVVHTLLHFHVVWILYTKKQKNKSHFRMSLLAERKVIVNVSCTTYW